MNPNLPQAPLGNESLECRSGVSAWRCTGPSRWAFASPTGGFPALFLPVSDGLVSKA
jgi:hypothetical protein